MKKRESEPGATEFGKSSTPAAPRRDELGVFGPGRFLAIIKLHSSASCRVGIRSRAYPYGKNDEVTFPWCFSAKRTARRQQLEATLPRCPNCGSTLEGLDGRRRTVRAGGALGDVGTRIDLWPPGSDTLPDNAHNTDAASDFFSRLPDSVSNAWRCSGSEQSSGRTRVARGEPRGSYPQHHQSEDYQTDRGGSGRWHYWTRGGSVSRWPRRVCADLWRFRR